MKTSTFCECALRTFQLVVFARYGRSGWVHGFLLMDPLVVERRQQDTNVLLALSEKFLQDDIVSVWGPTESETPRPRLCAVGSEGRVVPLCVHEDDVETDLFGDPRQFGDTFWTEIVSDDHVVGSYGEGYYGQRPVPSLGGGPGYGAEADEVWSISTETLQRVRDDNVRLPVLDVGISHGEKARGGSLD